MRRHIDGPLGMLAGFILFSLVPIGVKLATDLGAGARATVLVRFAVGLLCVGPFMAITGQRLRTGNLRALVLRGVFGGVAVMFFFIAVSLSGAGMGMLLNYTHSIWANVLAVMCLRHRPPARFWLLLVMAVVGLYLVIHPEAAFSSSARFWGMAAGLLSGVLGGSAILCIKELRRTDSALAIFFSFALAGFIVGALSLVPVVAGGSAEGIVRAFSWPAWGILAAMGVVAFGGQMLFTAGYRRTSIQLGSILSLTAPTLAVFLGWLILGEELTIRFAVGAGLVLVACGLTGALESSSARGGRPPPDGAGPAVRAV